MTTTWTQVVRIGELESSTVVYAPWLGRVTNILRDVGFEWLTKGMLIVDVDADFDKSTVTVEFAPLGLERGASMVTVTITLTPNAEESDVTR